MDLIPLPYRLAIAAFFVAICTLGLFAYGHRQFVKGEAATQVRWDAERVALKAQVQAQAARNLDLQRAAEKRYVVQGEIRDHYITKTITEIRHETANLAACVVSAPAVRMFNDAGSCASEDSASACGTDGKVPDAATTR
jgi:hypothetical protein